MPPHEDRVDRPPTDGSANIEGPLADLIRLLGALSEQGIRYCHWKSTIRLHDGLAGKTDLDLLVDRRDGARFSQAMAAHGLKRLAAAPGSDHPGLEHYLGLDGATGRLFHLHVHYQLVLGEQHVKSYRLPLEARFLDSARIWHGVPVPSPELELIVLCLRAILKYRDRDGIKDVLSIRSPGIPDEMLDEIRFLVSQTSTERIAEVLATVPHVVAAGTVLRVLELVTTAPRAGLELLRIRSVVRRCLRPYARHGRAAASRIYLREMVRSRRRYRRRPRQRMRLSTGGATIALVGADGAGKSTLRSALTGWLAWKLDVHALYLGSKEPSWHTGALYLAHRAFRRSGRLVEQKVGKDSLLAEANTWSRDRLLDAHHLSVAIDRYRRYRHGHQLALTGSIVVYDRYPLASLRAAVGPAMDGPRIDQRRGRAARLLGGLERRLYRRIRPPDVIFALDVSPAIAVARKPDHDLEAVSSKSLAVSALRGGDSGEAHIAHVSADRQIEPVVLELKAQTWRLL